MTVRYLGIIPRVPVYDLQRVIAFYTATLGFTLHGTWPDEAPTFAMLDRDDAQLQLYVAARQEQCGAVMLNVEVTDASAVHAELVERLPIEWGPEDYWYGRREFAIRDPEGNLVIVTQEI
jgi:catechol 2,3-dioxygenase-like lactoylglutathione lyase family enzyme